MNVSVGQLWADNDKRSVGRTVRVVSVGATHAVVKVVSEIEHRPSRHYYGPGPRPTTVGQERRIRLDRFKPTSTGYRLAGTGRCVCLHSIERHVDRSGSCTDCALDRAWGAVPSHCASFTEVRP